jgi:hypothetical protein
MNELLAGMILALAYQVAEPNRYSASASADPATAASTAGGESNASGNPTTPAPANLFENPSAAAETGEPAPAAQAPEPAAAATTPLRFEPAPPTGSQPDPADAAPPQRSVLAPFAKPSDLMKQLMKAPAASQLSGVPMTLGEAVREARNRQEQTVRAKAYWELAAASADYYLALLENTELGVLQQSVAAPAKQWDLRATEAQTRLVATQRAAQGAQLRLHQLVGRAGGPLPLPADVPHCGRYNAEYEEIFGSRPNLIAKQLSELMPLRYADLRSQAQAVADAEAWRDEVSRRRSATDDGLELLQSQDLLSLHRRTFVATARAYNEEIAEYTELAAPAEVAPDRLVAMMIRTSATSDELPWQSSGVQQANAETTAPPDVAALSPAAKATQPSQSGQPQTFANEGYREVRRPLGRLLNRDREHSIVSRFRRLRDRIDERLE